MNAAVLALACNLLIAALPAGARSMDLPASVVNGRFFYEPAVDGQRLRIWLDTDGSGFITEATVTRLYLHRAGDRAAMPAEVAQPTANGGLLPVVKPDPNDPIFDDVDAQFGATWFAGRIVRLDYRRSTLSLLAAAPRDLGRLGTAPLSFSGPYASVEVTVAGTPYRMSLDTAATVALNPATLASLHDGWGAVRATSFLKTSVLNAWHAAHPQWPYIAGAGAAGVAMLRVPHLSIGTYAADNVWFSTRPDDDVFKGETVTGKIGPTAFSQAVLTLDYPAAVALFD